MSMLGKEVADRGRNIECGSMHRGGDIDMMRMDVLIEVLEWKSVLTLVNEK